MSMLSCRVLCLLAIVLCCVGVAHASAAPAFLPPHLVEEAQKKVEETLKLKAQCEEATNAARQAANEALVFAHDTKVKLETIAANPEEVEKRKSEGFKLIEKVMKAAEKAGEVANKTFVGKEEAITAVSYFEEGEVFDNATKADDAATIAISNATDAIDAAKLYAGEVKDVLQKLEAAVAAAKEKEKEKQLEPQPQQQEQTNETSLDEQQGHTEGNKTEETQETQSSSDAPDVHETSAIPLPTNATITNGITRNDGSSSPALLRVPLLLLLLSVLGCMAVC